MKMGSSDTMIRRCASRICPKEAGWALLTAGVVGLGVPGVVGTHRREPMSGMGQTEKVRHRRRHGRLTSNNGNIWRQAGTAVPCQARSSAGCSTARNYCAAPSATISNGAKMLDRRSGVGGIVHVRPALRICSSL